MLTVTAVLVTALILTATLAGVLAGRREEDAPSQGGRALVRSIVYWLLTVVVAFELAAGALWDLLRIEYVRVVLMHLGYPLYLLIILGVWRIPGALVLLIPRLPRVKEWAYAGAFFDYSGAAASHLLVGDRAAQWAAPMIFAAFTLVSWSLRPASRRLPKHTPAAEMRAAVWAVPIVIVAAMLVVAFFTLPKGAPPQ